MTQRSRVTLRHRWTTLIWGTSRKSAIFATDPPCCATPSVQILDIVFDLLFNFVLLHPGVGPSIHVSHASYASCRVQSVVHNYVKASRIRNNRSSALSACSFLSPLSSSL